MTARAIATGSSSQAESMAADDVPRRTAAPVVDWHVPTIGAKPAEVTAAGRNGVPHVRVLALGVETS